MGWFRSEEMEYVSIIIQAHVAYRAVGRLGELGAIQFEDMNGEMTAFQRRYTSYIRRCDEAERVLRFFESEMAAAHITPQVYDMVEFARWRQTQVASLAETHTQLTLLDSWESELKRREHELLTLKSVKAGLLGQYVRKVERYHLLSKARQLMGTDPMTITAEMDAGSGAGAATGATTVSKYGQASPSLLAGHKAAGALDVSHMAPMSSTLRFEHVAGVMRKEDEGDFVRLLRRVSRGNCFVQFADLEEPLEDEKGNQVLKVVFIIFYRARALERKLNRLCDAFDAHRYPLPSSFGAEHEVKESVDDLRSELEESSRLLAENRHMTELALEHMAAVLDKWYKGVRREKATYHTLNMFDSSVSGMLQGRGWVLKNQQERVIAAVQSSHSEPGATAYIQRVNGDWPTPPTHFVTNKFTGVFQEVVNTYGVPRYREANPALFTAVTFPFLFAIMYGDVGHATLLFIFSALMVAFEKPLSRRKLNELVGMAFGGRYMLLLMGVFSIYCGIVYNDCFSLPIPLFDSKFTWTANNTAVRLGPAEDVYAFGVDPVWRAADNGLLFYNSLKMKISVVFGVVQMTFGILLKMTNAIHFKSQLDFWFECVPQLLFMLSLFGYMLFLIFFKWTIDWSAPPAGASAPPSLIDTLIGIVLTPGTVNDAMFIGQDAVQIFLLLIVFFSVPVMLFVKPCVLRHRARKARQDGPSYRRALRSEAHGRDTAFGGEVEMKGLGAPMASDLPPEDSLEAAPLGGGGGGGGHGHGHGHGDGEEFDFVEVMIHQVIETIEFVLGTVSNTASYLRLWALSLAHSELAEVFWERSMVGMINTGNAVGIFVGYAVFAFATFGVLCVMDVLECFLHALRLHWVEFQNKFYKADGYKFQPFHFDSILKAAAQDS